MSPSIDERWVARLLRFRWLLWLGLLTLAIGGVLLWRWADWQRSAMDDAHEAMRSLHEVRLRAHAEHVLASIANLHSAVPQQERLQALATQRHPHDVGHLSLHLLDRNGASLFPQDAIAPLLPGHYGSQAVALWLATAQRGGGLVRFSAPLPIAGPHAASGARSHAELVVSHTAVVHPVHPWDWTLVVAAPDPAPQGVASYTRVLLAQHRCCPWVLPLVAPLVLSLGVGLLVAHGFLRRMRTWLGMWRADIAIHQAAQTCCESLLQAVFENAAVGMVMATPQGRFLRVNQHFCDLLQRTREELLGTTLDCRALTDPRDRAATESALQWAMQSQNPRFRLEKRYCRPDGSTLWVSQAAQLVRTPQGEPDHLFVVVQDIQERKSAEQALLLAASVFTAAREAIMITELDGTIVDVNESFTRITGYERAQALGQNPRMLKSGRQNDAYYRNLWTSLQRYGHWHSEIWNRHKNGELFASMQTISLVRDEHGQPRHYVALFSDITAVKRHQQQLEHMAQFDALTGLPNRALLADRLQQSMLAVQRRDLYLATVYLDLDGFKAINERIGHDAADGVLAALAARMRTVLREGDTLARVGGDEFVAVLADLPDVASCAPMLDRLLAAAMEPVPSHGETIQTSASLGVTFYPQTDSIDAEQLLRQADQAMYQAKVAGKNRYHLFDAEHDRNVRGKHESIERIRHALLQNELVLYYQPKVDMRTGQVIGAEALLRWQHPRRGVLLPGAFLPDVENDPFAVELGEWVLRTAVRQVQEWLAQSVDLCVSVNVGARQLQQSHFVDRLRNILARFPDLPQGRLELEILESNALEDLEGISQVIMDCEALGVSFALDDFGTGYSSLTYLRRLPVKTIKIDQSFVRDMLEDADDLAILTGVIGLAQAFHREVIAEGVETVDHGTALLQLGCPLGQGYGIARPMPAAAIPIWVREWRPDPAWNPEEQWRIQTDYRI